MSNSKISALTSATTPLAGTEVLPVVQSSATTQVTVANLTAGRAVSVLSLTSTNDSTINGLTAGKGNGAVVTNTAYGYQSLSANLTGIGTTANGYQAGKASLGNYNTFVGYSAGLTKTGNFNTAFGASTLQLTDGGTQCTAVGYGAAYPCTADRVTAIGNQALGANTSGGYNTAVGYQAGQSLTTGTFNCYFGYLAINSGVAVTNEIVVGNSVTGNGSNTTTIGNSSTTATYFPGGNIVPVAAKGINFTANTPAAGMTSQLLNWYEEGTFTPNQGAGLTLVGAFSSTGKYTRIGRQVSISGTVTGATSVAVTAAGVITSNLPFTVGTAGHGDATNAAVTASATVICTSTSVTSAAAIAATGTITFSATYFV
jgi:hypothetical protein